METITTFDFSIQSFKNLVEPVRELFKTLFFSVRIEGVPLVFVLFFFWAFALVLGLLLRTRSLPSPLKVRERYEGSTSSSRSISYSNNGIKHSERVTESVPNKSYYIS